MTIKRFELVPYVGTGSTGMDADGNVTGAEDPIRPDIDGSYTLIGNVGKRALVKRTVPDGTATTPTTIADVTTDGFDVNPSTLTVAQRAAIKTFLANNDVDVSNFDTDNPTNRKKLLVFVFNRVLGWDVADIRKAFTDYGTGD